MSKEKKAISVGDEVKFAGWAIQNNPLDRCEPFVGPEMKYEKIIFVGDHGQLTFVRNGYQYVIHRRQVTSVRRKKQKVVPRFVGYCRTNEFEFITSQSAARFEKANSAVFIIKLSDFDRMSDVQKKLYGVPT